MSDVHRLERKVERHRRRRPRSVRLLIVGLAAALIVLGIMLAVVIRQQQDNHATGVANTHLEQSIGQDAHSVDKAALQIEHDLQAICVATHAHCG